MFDNLAVAFRTTTTMGHLGSARRHGDAGFGRTDFVGGVQLRRAVVPGLHVQRQREPVEFDRDELPPGQRPADRAGQDHGHAGGHRLGRRDRASPPGGWRPITWPAATCRA